jgi:hypothetical protein
MTPSIDDEAVTRNRVLLSTFVTFSMPMERHMETILVDKAVEKFDLKNK